MECRRRGELLGWSALLADGVMTTSAVATEATKTIEFETKELKLLCEQDHEVGYHVMRQVLCWTASHGPVKRCFVTLPATCPLVWQEPMFEQLANPAPISLLPCSFCRLWRQKPYRIWEKPCITMGATQLCEEPQFPTM